jgi:hypothetical protein
MIGAQHIIRGPFGTLRLEQDVDWITTNLPQPDPNWRYTDRQGHEHYRGKHDWPTLNWIVDETWWDEDLQEEDSTGHWACPICGEAIEPGMLPPPTHAIPIVGQVQCYLNDEPVTKEHAQTILDRWVAEQKGETK